jgi:hypothetical protein
MLRTTVTLHAIASFEIGRADKNRFYWFLPVSIGSFGGNCESIFLCNVFPAIPVLPFISCLHTRRLGF